MSYSPFLPNGHWPLAHLHNSLFEHFFYNKYCNKYDDLVHLYERETFIKALNSNPKLSEFWTMIQEQHRERKDYFLSLTNEDEPYDSYWIRGEYDRYLQKKALEELPEEDRKALEKEFDKFRPAAYQAALEGEAKRLNCDVSDVRPRCAILPWKSDNDEESPLVKLPDDIFGRFLSKLDTLDIFRMTLVCRKWKSLIHSNAKQLKRAEHAVTTHLITCTDWMDPPKTPPCAIFLRQYQLFNWCLMRWYCGISENLETLILDHPISYAYLATLFESCPKLKHLRIANDNETSIATNEVSLATVHLRELKVFLHTFSYSFFFPGSTILRRDLHRDILVSSEKLQVFKGSLNTEDMSTIDARSPVSNVFSKLIALDLTKFTPSALEILAYIDHLQLKYLKLGYLDFNSQWDALYDEERARNAMHKLLPKLNQLEVLITSTNMVITNETIQLLVDIKSSLSFAVLYHAHFPDDIEAEEWEIPMEKDPLQPDVIQALQDMFLSNNPAIDLSEIHFVLVRGQVLDDLEAMDTGFTFLRLFDDNCEPKSNTELYHPQMQRRLGIEF